MPVLLQRCRQPGLTAAVSTWDGRTHTFMQRLVQDSEGHKMFLVLDNLRAHHAEEVAASVQAHEIEVFYLPPELLSKVDETARKLSLTRAEFMKLALTRAVEAEENR